MRSQSEIKHNLGIRILGVDVQSGFIVCHIEHDPPNDVPNHPNTTKDCFVRLLPHVDVIILALSRHMCPVTWLCHPLSTVVSDVVREDCVGSSLLTLCIRKRVEDVCNSTRLVSCMHAVESLVAFPEPPSRRAVIVGDLFRICASFTFRRN